MSLSHTSNADTGISFSFADWCPFILLYLFSHSFQTSTNSLRTQPPWSIAPKETTSLHYLIFSVVSNEPWMASQEKAVRSRNKEKKSREQARCTLPWPRPSLKWQVDSANLRQSRLSFRDGRTISLFVMVGNSLVSWSMDAVLGAIHTIFVSL